MRVIEIVSKKERGLRRTKVLLDGKEMAPAISISINLCGTEAPEILYKSRKEELRIILDDESLTLKVE